jgi:hypothetical protein
MPRTAPRVLDEEQLSTFEHDGFHIARQLFKPEEIDTIRERFMAFSRLGPIEGLHDMKVQDPNDPLSRYPRIMHPHRHPEYPIGPLSRRYMLDQRIGDILHDLFGEPALAAQTMFYFKPPGSRGQDLHQDNFYLRIKPGTCMAAWIAIDNADRENGGMVVVPGSHRMQVVCPEQVREPSRFFTTEHIDVPAGMHEQPVDMKAGDVLFFTGSVIHGSYPNTSRNRFRRALICHYAPISCTEAAQFYHPMYDFQGNVASRETATGGGPCGEAHETVKGPH